jgi:hypothetical protein
MSASHSAQDMVRPGDAVDLYYYDHQTAKKQCWPTTINTKFVQQFNNLTGGSSVFTIPPQQGIQDVICTFSLDALAAATGLALNRGWGYQLIKQVSYRYGGSSQYFLSGDQILQNALRAQPSREAASDILLLGGAAALPADLTAGTQYASVVLTLPHATPSGVGKAHPFPSDCLTQQIQITVELNSISSMFSVQGASPSPVPTQLSSATFQVQQVMLNNAGDALARRVDLAENAYAFPAEFVQQKQVISLASGTADQSVVLTGFRSGEVKAIHCWLNRASDVTAPGVAGLQNPWNWVLPKKVEMTYAGDIYARFDSQSSTLWNMINGDKYPGAQSIALQYFGTGYSGASQVSTWVELPFAQPFVNEDEHNVLVHGKPITNGIVNLVVATPYSASDWVLNVSYIYNTTLLFSQGTVDYVF